MGRGDGRRDPRRLETATGKEHPQGRHRWTIAAYLGAAVVLVLLAVVIGIKANRDKTEVTIKSDRGTTRVEVNDRGETTVKRPTAEVGELGRARNASYSPMDRDTFESRRHPSARRTARSCAWPFTHSSESRENLVLTVGAVQKRKNIARLVKAFEGMPEGWKLAIAGAAEGFGAAEELRAVEESSRRADIQILGYVSQEALEELYRRARIFAFPSLDEGFGMPVLDAMARGVPVVASNRSAIPEVAGDAALLVKPEEVEELGAALARLASDKTLRDDLVHRGWKRAAELPWEAAVARTWRVYEELK